MRLTRPLSLSALVALSLLLVATPSRAAAPNYRQPGKDWGKGPVKWIMSEEEEKEFKKLRTDEERLAFATAFWSKRDPTPGTPENEFEAIFWKKVEEADKGFGNPAFGALGSLTDKGRTFILLGSPTKTDTDARGRAIWTFDADATTGMKEPMTLMFAPGTTTPLLLDRKTLEAYVVAHPETRGIGWKLPVMAQAPAEQDLPTNAPAPKHVADDSPESRRQIPILDAVLSKGSGPTDVPFQVACDFYAAADGTTLTVVTVEAPREAAHGGGDASLLPFARLVPAAGAAESINLTGDLPFVPAAPADTPASSYVYQARSNLSPGAWKLAIVVEDKVVPGTMGSRVETIQVPDYRGSDLQLSSVSLLSNFAKVQSEIGPDAASHAAGPYILGSFRLVPRAVPALRQTDALNFYYQVYHPASDPATGRPSLEITTTFYLKEGGTWRRYRPPLVRALAGQVDLYSIDVKDLLARTQALPAELKMEIKVVDKAAGGKQLIRELPFTVN